MHYKPLSQHRKSKSRKYWKTLKKKCYSKAYLVREEETTEGKKDEKVYETYRKQKVKKAVSPVWEIEYYIWID